MERAAVHADRHRRRRHRRPEPDHAADRGAGAHGDPRGGPRALRRRRAHRRDAGGRGARADPARGEEAGARAREQDRRPVAGGARARVPPPRLRRAVPGLCAPRLEHRRPARRDPRSAPGRVDAHGARTTRRSASRSSGVRTSASRRSTTASSAKSARSCRRCRERRATRSTRSSSAASARSSSSTPPAFAASAVSGRGSSTTPSCARSTRRERADVALVLIDASQGIVEGDITAVEVARKAHCATLIVLAKWDICEVTIEEIRPELQRRLRQRPDFITVSSVSGRGVTRLLDKVAELYDRYVQRISTGELNRLLAELKAERQPPSKGQPPPQPALRRAGPDAAAALPVHRQRPGPRDARLRLLGREPAPRAARPRGRAGRRRLPRAVVGDATRSSSARGVGDRRSRTCSRERGHDVSSRAATRSTTRRTPRRTSSSSRCRATRSASVLAHVGGDAPILSLAKGLDPATGERLSTLVRDRPVAVLSGPEHGGGGAAGLPGATVIASEDERARASASGRFNSSRSAST